VIYDLLATTHELQTPNSHPSAESRIPNPEHRPLLTLDTLPRSLTIAPMAGHSHYSNILRRKTAVDKKRAKIWGKVAKKLMVAAKRGGDPAANLALRYIIDEAKSVNMPKDTIQKAVDKGSGASGTDNFENITYEAYGPGGIAMIIEALTDNRSRTAPDLRSTLDKYGGNLATAGAVSFVFTKKSVFTIARNNIAEDALMELVLDAGAEDVKVQDEVYEVLASPNDFHKVKDALDRAKIDLIDSQITHLPGNTVTIDADVTLRFNKLLDALDDNDDIQNVYHNAELAR
jgi:YebC/PmpR family DNA-binding regulatory protein